MGKMIVIDEQKTSRPYLRIVLTGWVEFWENKGQAALSCTMLEVSRCMYEATEQAYVRGCDVFSRRSSVQQVVW